MTDPTCKECWDQHWIGVQHPLKPAGVSMYEIPCPKCNLGGGKRKPLPDMTITVTNQPDPARYPAHTITTTDGED